MKHYGGGPITGGIGKVGAKSKGAPNSKPVKMKVPSAINNKVNISKGDYLHGEMSGQGSGGHGGNVKAGKYHKAFG